MIVRFGLAMLGIAMAAGAQTVPAGWQTMNNEDNACQVALPAGWIVSQDIKGMAREPKGAMSVLLVRENDFKTEPLDETTLKMFRAGKVFENSARRIFIEGQTTKFGPNVTKPWKVWLPAKTKGSCHLTISIRPGGSEETAKRIADSLGAAK
jgi:hypothetical protein